MINLNEALGNVESNIADEFASGKTLVTEDSHPPQTAAMVTFLEQRRLLMQGMIDDCERVKDMIDAALAYN